jgi:hypothetical protein
VGDHDDHEDNQHDTRLDEDGDVALRTPPKRKGFLAHRKYAELNPVSLRDPLGEDTLDDLESAMREAERKLNILRETCRINCTGECVAITTGEASYKGSRYEHGQFSKAYQDALWEAESKAGKKRDEAVKNGNAACKERTATKDARCKCQDMMPGEVDCKGDAKKKKIICEITWRGTCSV